jgi:hypothetical protein
MYQDNATGYYYTFKVDNAVNGTLSLYSRNGSGADILGLSQDRLGKVGIGTTAPAGLLHVSSDTAATGLTYFTQANASADSFDLNFRKARGTAASPTVITTVDELGVINFTGYGGAAGYITGAAIKAISQGTIADSRVPANLTFWTGTDAQPSVLTKRLTISPTAVSLVGYTSISGGLDVTGGNGLYVTQNLMVAGTGSSYVMGKFGIGTTTPDQSLDVRGNIAMGRRAQSAIDRFIGITDTTGGVGNARGGINITQTAGGSTSMTFHTGTWGTTDTDSMFIASNGNVGIGTTTPGQKLTVVGNGQFTAVGSGAYSSDLSLTADGTLTTSASDIALKMNLVPLNATTTSTSSISILDKVIGLKPYTFNWISDPTGSKDIGLIAQDVEGIFPEITFTNKVDGYKGINYSRLPVILVSAIQELSDKVVKVGSYVVDGVAHYTHVIAVKFTGEEAEITNIKTEKICFDEDKKVCITESILNELIAKNPITCITSDTSTATASTTDTTDSSTEPMPTSTTDALASTTEEIIPEATSTEPVIEESVATSTEEVILEVTSTNT